MISKSILYSILSFGRSLESKMLGNLSFVKPAITVMRIDHQQFQTLFIMTAMELICTVRYVSIDGYGLDSCESFILFVIQNRKLSESNLRILHEVGRMPRTEWIKGGSFDKIYSRLLSWARDLLPSCISHIFLTPTQFIFGTMLPTTRTVGS